MNRNEQLVVVLTRSYATGVGIIRALGAAGYLVDMIASVRLKGLSEFASKSRYLHEYREIISPKFHLEGDTDDALVAALLEYKGKYDRKPVLFPTDDYTASIMDENRPVLEDVFLMPGISNEIGKSMISSMEKDYQSHLAKEAGIMVPHEWNISLAEKPLALPEDMIFPCFVKPIESISGYKKEMAVCKNKKELRLHLQKLKKRKSNRSVLVQEYLKIDREIDLSGVCIDQEVIIPGIIKKTCVAKYERGVTLSGMLFPFEELGDLSEKIICMMKKFHYTGMFDMEFNLVGDTYYFNEVNLRSGGPNYSYYVSGANLPSVFVSEIVEHKHDLAETKLNTFGLNFIYEKVAWEDYLKGYLSRKSLDRRIADADFGLLNDKNDPGPYLFAFREFKKKEREKKKQEQKKRIKESKPIKLTKKWIKKQKKHLKRSKFAKTINSTADSIHRQFETAEKYLKGYPQLRKENQRSQYNMRPRVMVAGRNYSSNLTMARSIGEAGYDVEVMHVYQTAPKKDEPLRKMQPDRYSKYIKAFYEVVTNRDDTVLRRALFQNGDKKHKMLLIPADDLVASVADKFYDVLKKRYILPNISDKQGEINRLMSKGVQKKLAIEAGLPVLNSCIIKAERGRFIIPDTVTYPCFIKPDVSRLASKSRMHRCDTKEELEGWLTVFSERKEAVMVVEDYVDIVNEYSILGVSTKNGAIGPAAFVAVKGGSKEHKGVALTGKILEIEELQPLADQLIQFVGSLEFDGLYDIDLIEAKDGKIYFVEINMRLGASGYAFTKCGVNLPGIFADYMIYHKPLDPTLRVDSSDHIFVSEKVLLDEFAGRRIEKQDYLDIMENSEIFFIKNEDDPKAYRYFKKFFRIAEKVRNCEQTTVPLTELPLEDRINKVKDRAVSSVSAKSFWGERKVRNAMESAHEKYGISYVEYDSRNLWKIPEDEMGNYLREQEILRQQREKSIASVVEKSGWKYDVVVRRMEAARKKAGATFAVYDAVDLWKYPVEEQKKYLKCIERTGCTEAEYKRYRIVKLKIERQNNLFLSVTSKQLGVRFNTDQEFQKTLDDQEKFFRTFRMQIRRSWFVTNKMSREQFTEWFGGCSQIIYRSLKDEDNKELLMFSINANNIAAVYDAIVSMDPGIVEECLQQHPELEMLSPGAMSKIRIVTVSSFTKPVLPGGECLDVAYAVLRTGGENGQNHQFYNGELFAAIDLESGNIMTHAADIDCRKYIRHPISEICFKGFNIPFFAESLELVRKTIERHRIEGYLGWDLVVTNSKPVLVSITSKPASVLISAPYFTEKMGIKDKMERYLWVDQKEKVENE